MCVCVRAHVCARAHAHMCTSAGVQSERKEEATEGEKVQTDLQTLASESQPS